MSRETIGSIPEFTDTGNPGDAEVKEEKETPSGSLPPEKEPADESQPSDSEVEKTQDEEIGEDTKEKEELPEQELSKLQGLRDEQQKLLEEIKTLRGERRQLREQELQQVEKQIQDKLDDVDPHDVQVMERVLKAKGYVSKDELDKTWRENIMQEELNKFLDKYPEFKAENDPNDLNWNRFKSELSFYRQPSNPREYGTILERTRKAISTVFSPSDRATIEAKKQTLRQASVGGGGKTGGAGSSISQSSNAEDIDKIEALRRGGWTEEEIKEIISKL